MKLENVLREVIKWVSELGGKRLRLRVDGVNRRDPLTSITIIQVCGKWVVQVNYDTVEPVVTYELMQSAQEAAVRLYFTGNSRVNEEREYRKIATIKTLGEITTENIKTIADWCDGTLVVFDDQTMYIKVYTLEGIVQANIGDYVCKGGEGEFWPVRGDIFTKTYTPV